MELEEENEEIFKKVIHDLFNNSFESIYLFSYLRRLLKFYYMSSEKD